MNITDRTEEISNYYDEFSKKQVKTGINLRHYYLFDKLRYFGLVKNSSVLEIGSGIGTLSELIVKYVSNGRIVLTDISKENISIAKARLSKFKNVTYHVTDMMNFNSKQTFDFIVLADVIEHIPIDQQPVLFKNLSKLIHSDSVIFINIPHPKIIEYFQKNDPTKLQIIDQAINAGQIMTIAEPLGFRLHFYQSYKLFHNQNDYVIIVFKTDQEVKYEGRNKIEIIIAKWKIKLKYILSLF